MAETSYGTVGVEAGAIAGIGIAGIGVVAPAAVGIVEIGWRVWFS